MQNESIDSSNFGHTTRSFLLNRRFSIYFFLVIFLEQSFFCAVISFVFSFFYITLRKNKNITQIQMQEKNLQLHIGKECISRKESPKKDERSAKGVCWYGENRSQSPETWILSGLSHAWILWFMEWSSFRCHSGLKKKVAHV